MESLLQQIAAGVATGGIYACLALALVMIYQSTGHINFAQGEMATFSTYVAWWCITALGLPYWAAFAAALVFGFTLGAVAERVLLRPLKNAPELSVVVVFMGLFLVINAMSGAVFGHETRAFPSPFPAGKSLGGSLISPHALGTIGVVLAVVVVLYVFFRFTRVGLAMRAAAQNPVSARLSGIPVSLMLALGWGVAAAIGAVAGMLVAPSIFLDPHVMTGVLIYAFAAALLGGMDNPWGAIVGGVLLGVIENLAGTYLVTPDLKLTVALVVIVAVLLVKPEGLFGRKLTTRV